MFTCKSHFGENVQQSRRDKLSMPGRDCCLDGLSVVVKSSVCRCSVDTLKKTLDKFLNGLHTVQVVVELYSIGPQSCVSIGQCNAMG